MTVAHRRNLKCQGTGRRSSSGASQLGQAPSVVISSSSTTRLQDSHQAIRASAPQSYPDLDGRRPQGELLPQLPLDVAEVGGVQPPGGEDGEGWRIYGPLHGVTDPGARSRVSY